MDSVIEGGNPDPLCPLAAQNRVQEFYDIIHVLPDPVLPASFSRCTDDCTSRVYLDASKALGTPLVQDLLC